MADFASYDPIVIVGTGQSNMLGHTHYDIDWTIGDRSTEPGVYILVYRGVNGADSFWLEGGPDHPDFPLAVNGYANGGISYSFARTIRRLYNRPVYLIVQAAGGQPINEWLPNGNGKAPFGVQYRSLMQKCLWAFNSPELSSKTLFLADYFLWHQGEADATFNYNTTGAQWLVRFEAIIKMLRNPNPSYSNLKVIGYGTPVLVGELFIGGKYVNNSSSDDRNVEIRKYQTGRDPYIINVPSSGLRSLDNLHFVARDLEDFGGRRYYEASLKVPKVIR